MDLKWQNWIPVKIPGVGTDSLPHPLSRHFFERCHQHIDLFFRIIEAKACPDCAVGKAEPFHEWLAAVVAGADKDLGGLVQLLGNLVRVEVVHGERDHPDTVGGWFRRIDLHSLELP
jgi:hypothetical protein